MDESDLGNLERLPKQPLGWSLSGIAIDGRSRNFAGITGNRFVKLKVALNSFIWAMDDSNIAALLSRQAGNTDSENIV